MFASSGYFRGITCPYYASGLCERPYCHFRHIKTDETTPQQLQNPQNEKSYAEELGLSVPKQPQHVQRQSSMLSMFGNALQQVHKEPDFEQRPPLNIAGPSSHYLSASNYSYKPTPILKVKPKKPVVPVYKPTPIAELKKAKEKRALRAQKEEFQRITLGAVGKEIEAKFSDDDEESVKPDTNKNSTETNKSNAKESLNNKSQESVKPDTNKNNTETNKSDAKESLNNKSQEPVEPDTKKNGIDSNKSDTTTSLNNKSQEIDEKDNDKSKNTEIAKQDANDKKEVTNDKVTLKDSADKKSTESTVSSAEKGKDEKSVSEQSVLKTDNNAKEKSDSKAEESQNKDSEKDSESVLKEPDKESKGDIKSKSESSPKTKCCCGASVASAEEQSSSNDSEQTDAKSEANKEASKDDKKAELNKSDSAKGKNDATPSTESSTAEKDEKETSKTNKECSSENCQKEKEKCEKDSEKENVEKKENDSSKSDKKKSHSSKDNSSSKHSSSSKSSDRHRHKSSNSDKSEKHSSRSKSSSRSEHSSKHKSKDSKSSSSSSSHKSRSSDSKSDNTDKDKSHSKESSSKSSSKDSSSKESKSKSHSSKSSSSSKPSSSSSHKSHKSSHSSSSNSKSRKTSSSEKSSRRSSTESKESHSTSKTTNGAKNIFEALSGSLDKPIKVASRRTSNIELFGEDSDTEQDILRTPSPVKTGKGERNAMDSLSDNDDVALLSDNDFEMEVPSGKEREWKRKNSNSFIEESYLKKKARLEAEDPDSDDGTPMVLGKKRTARATEEDILAAKRMAFKQSNFRPSPAQVMHNRFAEMQRRAELAAQQKEKGIRTAHTPTKSLLGNGTNTFYGGAKKRVGGVLIKGQTPASRVAHTPKPTVLQRPTIPASFGSKIPSNIRQSYLNRMIEECLKIYPKEKDAFDRALAEEDAVYQRASAKNIYLNLSIIAIKKLRDELNSKSTVTSPTKSGTFSHEFVLGGSKAASTSFTVKRSGGPQKDPAKLTGVALYNKMSDYVLSDHEMKDNGYPFPDPDSSKRVIIKWRECDKDRFAIKGNIHICIRCGKRYEVLPSGQYPRRENCVYHWGKCWKRRITKGVFESRWTCCDTDFGATGCSVAKYHVHERNKASDLVGYVKTKPRHKSSGDYGVYAMDCEMIYTTAGSELARVTVIGPDMKSVFEKLVRPENKIIDYNTRFSGITEKDLEGVDTTLSEVQAVLMSLFNDKTILIGHSLESDLVALKIVHNNVVDTSVVFPHRLGPPYKRALRTLMEEILQKIIQDAGADGHDSKEDACACMDLMHWKIKEDLKREKRR